MTPAFRLLTDRDGPCLLCLICHRISHHPQDIRERYCGACHRFLDDVPLEERHLQVAGRSPGLLLGDRLLLRRSRRLLLRRSRRQGGPHA